MTIANIQNCSTHCSIQMISSPDTAAKDTPVNTPRIGKFITEDGAPQYFLFVEQLPLCHVGEFCKALFLWFSAHYIFHLQYNSSIRELSLFFQECIFGIPMHCKKTATYLQTATDIQKLILD